MLKNEIISYLVVLLGFVITMILIVLNWGNKDIIFLSTSLPFLIPYVYYQYTYGKKSPNSKIIK